MAARDGIITEIIVFKGQPVVKEGDTVSRGQVLVIPEAENEETRAIIRANVWYDAVGEASTRNRMILYTGRKKTFWGVKIGPGKFYLTKIKPPFKQYKRREELKRFFYGGILSFLSNLLKKSIRN